MELHERISVIRKAKGLTQEQLGELVGVTRQAVSKWESGQAVPDALTIVKLCRELDLSADYVLLGKEPGGSAETVVIPDQVELDETDPVTQMPDICPCCGRTVSGTLCPVCGYPLPIHPPRGSRYAVVVTYGSGTVTQKERLTDLVKYCGFSQSEAESLVKNVVVGGMDASLRRDLTDHAAHWLAGQLNRGDFFLKIVEDLGEPEEELVQKESAMELPASEKKSGGLGFWGVVGAVIVALLILSFL